MNAKISNTQLQSESLETNRFFDTAINDRVIMKGILQDVLEEHIEFSAKLRLQLEAEEEIIANLLEEMDDGECDDYA